jgi:hypothetical protein
MARCNIGLYPNAKPKRTTRKGYGHRCDDQGIDIAATSGTRLRQKAGDDWIVELTRTFGYGDVTLKIVPVKNPVPKVPL